MNIKLLNQPGDFDHLTEWWQIERERKGDYTALRILEKQYPKYARRLSEWVIGYLEMEADLEEFDEKELTPEEQARIERMAENALRDIKRRLFWADVIE